MNDLIHGITFFTGNDLTEKVKNQHFVLQFSVRQKWDHICQQKFWQEKKTRQIAESIQVFFNLFV